MCLVGIFHSEGQILMIFCTLCEFSDLLNFFRLSTYGKAHLKNFKVDTKVYLISFKYRHRTFDLFGAVIAALEYLRIFSVQCSFNDVNSLKYVSVHT